MSPRTIAIANECVLRLRVEPPLATTAVHSDNERWGVFHVGGGRRLLVMAAVSTAVVGL